jgi:hypothetical protein
MYVSVEGSGRHLGYKPIRGEIDLVAPPARVPAAKVRWLGGA